MMFLPSNTLHVDKLASAIAWGYVITATREISHGIDRYRFEIAVRGESIQPLQLTHLKNGDNQSPVINTPELKLLMSDAGMSMDVFNVLQKNGFEDAYHLKGCEHRTACGQAYHLPCMSPSRLVMVTEFLELPESQQCARCRNVLDPAYLPITRLRRTIETNSSKPFPKKVLPG